jgi:hypothetical protein
MTIVAGFKTVDGILLCADSQFTGGAKVNLPKLFGYSRTVSRTETVQAAFALSGHEVYAKMAIEECVEALFECDPKELTRKKARHILMGAIKSIHADYVDSRPDQIERENARFDLIIGCWLPKGGGLNMFRASGPGIMSGENYYSAGTGAYLGDYFIKDSFMPSMGIKRAAILAIQSLLAAKTYDAHCGGPSQFLAISNSGQLSNFIPYNVHDSESYVAHFDREARRLLGEIGNAQSKDEEFEKQLSTFVSEIRRIRKFWTSAGSPEYQRIMEMLWALKQVAQQSHESPTHDRTAPLALPE